MPPQEVPVPPAPYAAQRARSATSREDGLPASAAVISAAPQVFVKRNISETRSLCTSVDYHLLTTLFQVNKPSVEVPTPAVISAEPALRNMKKEATRFVPTALRVQRAGPATATSHRPIGPNLSGIHKPSRPAPPKAKPAAQPMKSTDEACEDFLREIADLL